MAAAETRPDWWEGGGERLALQETQHGWSRGEDELEGTGPPRLSVTSEEIRCHQGPVTRGLWEL